MEQTTIPWIRSSLYIYIRMMTNLLYHIRTIQLLEKDLKNATKKKEKKRKKQGP